MNIVQIFSHFIVDGRLGYFQFRVTVNCAFMNNLVRVFSCTYVHISVGYIPRSGIAGS